MGHLGVVGSLAQDGEFQMQLGGEMGEPLVAPRG